MKVCFSGDGQGALAATIRQHMLAANEIERQAQDSAYVKPYEFVADMPGNRQQSPCDVAICTTGRMLIRRAEDVTDDEEQYLYEGNYLKPKLFIERHAHAMRDAGVGGLILVVGSNASYYGNVHAEAYAAYKTALRKYLELRRREVKRHGVRISHLAFGGIEGPFWAAATAGVDASLTQGIVAGGRRMLTLEEAARVVLTVIRLPPTVTVADALIVSTDYQ